MGIDIPIFFMTGDFNSFVFKSENSPGMGKKASYFVVRIAWFSDYFQWGQKLEDNFPPGTIFWPNFPVGKGGAMTDLLRRLVFRSFKTS